MRSKVARFPQEQVQIIGKGKIERDEKTGTGSWLVFRGLLARETEDEAWPSSLLRLRISHLYVKTTDIGIPLLSAIRKPLSRCRIMLIRACDTRAFS